MHEFYLTQYLATRIILADIANSFELMIGGTPALLDGGFFTGLNK